MRCWEILLKIQCKEKILGSLETTYLVEMNKYGLVSEGHGKKNIHKNERMVRCLILRNIKNCRSVVDSAKKCKENGKDESLNILRSACLYVKKNNLRGP